MGSRRRRSQLGETLIESLLSIAMLSAVVIGAFASIATTLTVSVRERNTAAASTVLRTVAEGLQSPDATYVDCATTSTYPVDAPAIAQTGFTARIASVRFRSTPSDAARSVGPALSSGNRVLAAPAKPTTTTTTTTTSTSTTTTSTTTTTVAPSTTSTTTTTVAPSTTTTTTPSTTSTLPPASWTVEFQSTCPTGPGDGLPKDYGLQEIRIEVSDPTGVQRSLTILKRRT